MIMTRSTGEAAVMLQTTSPAKYLDHLLHGGTKQDDHLIGAGPATQDDVAVAAQNILPTRQFTNQRSSALVWLMNTPGDPIDPER
jgi:hypothetical protein